MGTLAGDGGGASIRGKGFGKEQLWSMFTKNISEGLVHNVTAAEQGKHIPVI